LKCPLDGLDPNHWPAMAKGNKYTLKNENVPQKRLEIWPCFPRSPMAPSPKGKILTGLLEPVPRPPPQANCLWLWPMDGEKRIPTPGGGHLGRPGPPGLPGSATASQALARRRWKGDGPMPAPDSRLASSAFPGALPMGKHFEAPRGRREAFLAADGPFPWAHLQQTGFEPQLEPHPSLGQGPRPYLG
jgi:hypothetical protein